MIDLQVVGGSVDNADMEVDNPDMENAAGALGLAHQGRHISGTITAVLVRYGRRVGGDAAVQEMLERAGETRTADELSDTSGWSSYEQALALFDAIAAVLNDPDVGRRIGEDLLRQHAGTEVAALLRSLGSPGEVLRNVATTSAKYSTVSVMESLEVGAGHGIVTARTTNGIVWSAHLCRYTEGVLSQVSPLFGLEQAEVEELECQGRGDERCLYRVTWGSERDPGRQVEHLEQQLAALTARFEALQASASELVTAESVDDVLVAVCKRVGLAVRAPQFLVAVHTGFGDGLRIQHIGFASEGEAIVAAQRLLDDAYDPSADGSALVVPVATPRRHFGVLAALYPDGYRFFPQERELLAAYAAHAAAVVEAAVALEDARRQNETARALLALGRSLADVRESDDVATRLLAAMPAVVGCDAAVVLLWREDRDAAEIVAAAGLSDEAAAKLLGVHIQPSDTPALVAMLETPAPFFFDATTDDPFLVALLATVEVDAAAVVPISAHGQLLGAIAVAFPQSVSPEDADLLERLTGMADNAATALLNTRLLETVRHQAEHDAITGLANPRLLAQRTDAAIASPRDTHRVALLFVDLDRFKAVNDTFGHAAGDDVLRQCAIRLHSVVRSTDTVARLGGDEFVVLLPDVDDNERAVATAARIVGAIEQPFDIAGSIVHLSASVGISVVTSPEDTYDDLLRRADIAMYVAKAKRRGPVSC